jgi:hypothetical protein
MGDEDKNKARALRSLLLSVSVGGLLTAGCTTNSGPEVRHMHAGPEHRHMSSDRCSAAVASNSAAAVNSVLRHAPDDPCIPAMLSALPPRVLARVNRNLVNRLPPEQLSAIPRSVLAQIGQAEYAAPPRRTNLGQGRQY